MPGASQPVVALPCAFEDTTAGRAYWDLEAAADLSTSRGIRFQLYCANPASIASFTCYFRSNNGWYNVPFAYGAPGNWQTVAINRLKARAEEEPGAWKDIDRIRLCAWRTGDTPATLYLSGLGHVPASGDIALIRAASQAGGDAKRARNITSLTGHTGRLLEDLGLSYILLDDYDVAPDTLRGKAVAILPYNPGMPDTAYNALRSFVAAGGRLVTCYNTSSRVLALAGFRDPAYAGSLPPGTLDSIRPAKTALTGLPAKTTQHSWNLTTVKAGREDGFTAAWWFNEHGAPTGWPAVVVSSKGVHFTHVLLPHDTANTPILLAAMVGHFHSAAWADAAAHRITRAGAFGPYTDYQAAITGLAEAAEDGRAKSRVEEARARHAEALQARDRKAYPEALRKAAACREALITAYAAAQPTRKGEWRGFWCHNAYGVSGMTWDEAIANLAENGFTAVIPNMLWGGLAYYPSEVLPVADDVATKGDAIAKCLAACKKYGIECHVWKVNWNMSTRAPKAFREAMVKAGRVQVSKDGAVKPDWLCPSHPDNQRLEIDAMVEVATKYDVDGIHFDYIRYPDREHCYCPGCKHRFEAAIGAAIADWPDTVLVDDTLRDQYLDFRRAQITKVVKTVHDTLAEKATATEISAAVFRNWPQDRDHIGQDWATWCQAGYLDFVCPMDYTPDTAAFGRQVRQQQAWVGGVPVRPGIGLSTWQVDAPVVRLFAHIQAARNAGATGFTVFNYGAREANDILPLCGLGITRGN